MSEGSRSVHTAYLAARQARRRLFDTVDHIQDRLTPEALREDALKSLRDQLGEWTDDARSWARANPGFVAAVSAAVMLYLFNRLRPRNDDDETAPDVASLTDEPAAVPDKEGTE